MVENKATFDAIGAITKMWTITGVGGADDLKRIPYRYVRQNNCRSKGKINNQSASC